MKFRKKNLTDEEKKKRAKIELIICLIFMAFVFAYSKILVSRSNYNSTSKEEFIYKVDLNTINKYDFDIKLNIDNNIYNYNGSIDNNKGTMNEYTIINGEYYDNKLEKADNIFYGVDNKYFNLSTINSYINDKNLKNNQYEINITDIFNNKLVDVLIYASINYTKEKIIINLDYSNLAHIKDNRINSYKVEYIISNYK